MRWQDLDQVVELERRCHPDDAWSAQTWWAELAARPRRAYISLVDDARVVGYAGLDSSGDSADIMTVAVDPDLRRGGYGRRLVAALLDLAQDRGTDEVLLEVRSDNTAAEALYRALGFRTIHVRRGYYRGGPGVAPADALVMRRGRGGVQV